MKHPPMPARTSSFHGPLATPGLEDFLQRGRKRWREVSVSLMNSSPYRAIASLFYHHSPTDLRFSGTAWFIGPQFLVTAAHVINQIQNVPIMAAFGGVSQGGVKMPQSSFVGASFFSEVNPRIGAHNDIAVIWLEPGKQNSSWLRFAPPSASGDARVVGAQFSAQRKALGTTLFEHSGQFHANSGHNLAYDIDTQRGQSGAPVISNSGTVIGIHQDGKGGFGTQQVDGVRLSDRNKGLAFDHFHTDWLKQFSGAN